MGESSGGLVSGVAQALQKRAPSGFSCSQLAHFMATLRWQPPCYARRLAKQTAQGQRVWSTAALSTDERTGLNVGNVTASVMSSKTTFTGMPILMSWGLMPTRLELVCVCFHLGDPRVHKRSLRQLAYKPTCCTPRSWQYVLTGWAGH